MKKQTITKHYINPSLKISRSVFLIEKLGYNEIAEYIRKTLSERYFEAQIHINKINNRP